MLRSVKELQGYTVQAVDGGIGQVDDFYFDDWAWIIRYLVVDTGTWLSSRKVLVSPVALKQPDWEYQMFPVTLTRQEVENSPDIDTDKPVSRQQEIELHEHFRWPLYWASGGFMTRPYVNAHTETAATQTAGPKEKAVMLEEKVAMEEQRGDPHLRSIKEVAGYNIQARDGEIGHVEDFIIEDQTWAVNYIVVDTRNWLPGRQVLLAPQWIEAVNWETARVTIDLARKTIQNSPEYEPSMPINADYETRLYDYYGRPKQ